MKCKLKYGDVVVYKDSVGIVRNSAVIQARVSVQWVHDPHGLRYYQPVEIANTFEVLPKDVGRNLVRLYDMGAYLD